MSKNKLLLLVALVLITFLGYFLITNNNGTIKKELRDFSVADTASIDKVFFADKSGHRSLLKRVGKGQWTVNDKYPARQDAVNTLLTTICRIEVRSPVGKAAYQNVMKTLSSNGVKVEIYSKDKKIKTYYVGDATADMMGTFMYLENSTVPFVIHIPGFNGFLTPRYFADARQWRSQVIFNYGEGEIKKIVAINNLEPEKSFRVEKAGDSYLYFCPENATRPSEIFQSQLAAYLAKYQLIGFERVTYDLDTIFRDSLLKTQPIRILDVESVKGKRDRIAMYRKPVAEGTLTSIDQNTGQLHEFDVDKMYATWNNDLEMIVVQYYVFDKLFKRPDQIKGFGEQ